MPWVTEMCDLDFVLRRFVTYHIVCIWQICGEIWWWWGVTFSLEATKQDLVNRRKCLWWFGFIISQTSRRSAYCIGPNIHIQKTPETWTLNNQDNLNIYQQLKIWSVVSQQRTDQLSHDNECGLFSNKSLICRFDRTLSWYMVRDMRKNITNVCVYICLPSRQEHRQGDGGSEENKKL